MSSGAIAACFSAGRLAARLPRPGSWRPYPAAQDRAAWGAVPAAARDHLLEHAAAELSRPWPVLRASDYLRFLEDGDRSAFEGPYFARRSRLGAAVMAAGLLGPDRDRISEVVDGVWLLCEETSWCVPAHELFAGPGPGGQPLPDPARPTVDLFAAETAGLLAWTDLLAGDLIGAIARARLRDEVASRVLRPYRESDEWWWFGLRNSDLNNWTPRLSTTRRRASPPRSRSV
jgi:hypothetical protein